MSAKFIRSQVYLHLFQHRVMEANQPSWMKRSQYPMPSRERRTQVWLYFCRFQKKIRIVRPNPLSASWKDQNPPTCAVRNRASIQAIGMIMQRAWIRAPFFETGFCPLGFFLLLLPKQGLQSPVWTNSFHYASGARKLQDRSSSLKYYLNCEGQAVFLPHSKVYRACYDWDIPFVVCNSLLQQTNS